MTSTEVAGSMMTEPEAREIFDAIKGALETTADLVIRAYSGQAWRPLGYSSWEAACEAEFRSTMLRPPKVERIEQHEALRAAGLSLRAISAVTGASVNTVRGDLQVYQTDTPVIGRDGKTYAPVQERKRLPEEIAESIFQSFVRLYKHAVLLGLHAGNLIAEAEEHNGLEAPPIAWIDDAEGSPPLSTEWSVLFREVLAQSLPEGLETFEGVERLWGEDLAPLWDATEAAAVRYCQWGCVLGRLAHVTDPDHPDWTAQDHKVVQDMAVSSWVHRTFVDRVEPFWGDEFRDEARAVFSTGPTSSYEDISAGIE